MNLCSSVIKIRRRVEVYTKSKQGVGQFTENGEERKVESEGENRVMGLRREFVSAF